MIIGIFQLIAAVFPGTSRSGATIVGALLIGVNRRIAAEFTFFLAIPVMFGASLLKIVKFGLVFSAFEFVLLVVGMLVAFIVSMITIVFLMDYIKKHDFKVFGWYRIILGVIVIAVFSAFEFVLLVVGMLVAFIVSMITIVFLMDYIKKHDFKVFGWYRIILGVIVIAYFMFLN